jgi:O-antigen ligase
VLACLALGAGGLARQLSLRELLLLTLLCTGTLLLVGLAAELALGTFRPWKAAYRFSGLTWPAFSAWDASLFILAALTLRRTSGRFRAALAAACVAFVLLLLTKTRASAGGLAAAAVAYVGFTWAARAKWIAVLVISLAGIIGVLAMEMAGGKGLDRLIDVVNLGRTESASDISGRAGLWQDLVPFVLEKPGGGYGYDSFWTPRRLLEIGQDNWGAPDAHNGFLNLTLGVGFVGAGLYAAVLLLGLWCSRAQFLTTNDVTYIFIFCALVVLIVNALFVSTQLAPALYSFLTLTLLARLSFVAPPRGEGAAK